MPEPKGTGPGSHSDRSARWPRGDGAGSSFITAEVGGGGARERGKKAPRHTGKRRLGPPSSTRRFSTTQAAAERLRRQGWPIVEVVEKSLAGGRFKRDFLGEGGGDVIAFSPKLGVLLVSATTRKELAKHVHASLVNEKVRAWVEEFRHDFEIWAWPDKEGREEGGRLEEYRYQDFPELARNLGLVFSNPETTTGGGVGDPLDR